MRSTISGIDGPTSLFRVRGGSRPCLSDNHQRNVDTRWVSCHPAPGTGSTLHTGRWIGFIALLFAMAMLGSSLVGSVPVTPPIRVVVLPTADVTLGLDVRQDGRLVTYTIHFDNVGNTVVGSVDLHDRLPVNSTFVGDPADVVDGVWNDTFENVAPGPHSVTLAVRLNEGVVDGDRVVNLVTMEYLSGGRPVVKTYEHEFRASLPLPPPILETPEIPTLPMWVLAAPILGGSAGLAGYATYRRVRRPKIEQVFLMHRSGMLIRHWAVSASPVRDIDILSAMFIILKEFVRDSFREKKGGLSEMHFGDSRLLLAEGQHSILATVVSGGRMNGIPGQIQAAVNDFEGRNGGSLPDWTGRLEVLDGAGDVIDNLVRGRYGHLRRAS